MPVLRSKVTGDMYIQVEVETPKNLTRRQRELLESLRAREQQGDLAAFARASSRKVKEFFEGKPS